MSETKQILEELKEIKHELHYIKDHMIDVDTVLDEDDRQAIKNAEKEFKEGKAIPLEQLKKDLGL